MLIVTDDRYAVAHLTLSRGCVRGIGRCSTSPVNEGGAHGCQDCVESGEGNDCSGGEESGGSEEKGKEGSDSKDSGRGDGKDRGRGSSSCCDEGREGKFGIPDAAID